jgi:hypothetical protein
MKTKHTETQYLTRFGKTTYIHGRESILFRDRERITKQYIEEEDHFTQTQLIALIAAMAARLLPLQLSLSLYSLALTHHTFCSQLCSLSRCLFIGKNGATAPALLQQRWLHMGCTILSMVGATTIVAF